MKRSELKNLIKEEIKSILTEGADWILLSSIDKFVDSYRATFLDRDIMNGDDVEYGDEEWDELYAKLSAKDKEVVDSITKELEDAN